MPLEMSSLVELLPAELYQKISNSRSMRNALTSAENYGHWFKNSGIPFFRTYTDHSETHSVEVFSTAVSLIHPDSYSAITDSDIAVLLCSCFCHDAGMHLTEKQFQLLVSENHSARYNDIDKKTWPEEWKTFLQEARRFNQAKLIDVFGDVRPIPEIPNDISDYNNNHRLLIGEFLRIQHPRIAHDLTNGLDVYLGLGQLLRGFSTLEADMIGLIGRSHGMALRQTFEHLEGKLHLREFSKAHPIFLMGLLRIADYAQIQASRAPRIALEINLVRSPLSSREWKVHQSVANITRADTDPEAIYIDSRPSTVEEFLRVRDWLTDLQQELDKTWAVLGEVYGRHTATGLDKLSLSIRRVRSNTFEDFKSEEFIPEKIAFRVAESEMLSLLLAPLYGDDPSYGLRELIQNARDSAIEATAINAPHLENKKAIVQVTIKRTDVGGTVRVADNGVGMDVNVIKNYFLNAGASYRASAAWQKAYLEESGKSKVSRSGRFGVGALAAFLIGNSITVRTKHWQASGKGLAFSAGLHDRFISIKPEECKNGCEIDINTTEETVNKLFRHKDHLETSYKFNNETAVNVTFIDVDDSKQEHLLSSDLEYTYKLSTDSIPEVKIHKSRIYQGSTFVNGIVVGRLDSIHGQRTSVYNDRRYSQDVSYSDFPFSDQHSCTISPSRDINLFVDDRDAACDINLARTEFNSSDSLVTAKINDLLFADLIQFFTDNGGELSHIRAKKHEKIKDILIVNRGSLVYRGDTFFPIDITMAEKYEVSSIIDLGSDYQNDKIITELFPHTFFSLRNSSITSKTALMHGLRNRRDLVEKGNLDYVALVAREVIATELLGTMKESSSSWLAKCLRSAVKIGQGYVIIEFGPRDNSLYEMLLNVRQHCSLTTLSGYYSKSCNFYYNPFKEEMPSASALAERWLAKYPDLNSVARILATSP